MVTTTLAALIVIYIVDMSGWSDTLTSIASHITGRRVTQVRPFTCSLCMVWWVCLAVSAINGSITLALVAYIALLSFLASTIGMIMHTLRNAIIRLINKLNDRIDELH